MFKVGERRKPGKVLPGIARVWVLRAESILGGGEDGSGDNSHASGGKGSPRRHYCVLRYQAHDEQRTSIVEKTERPERGSSLLQWDREGDPLPFEVDLPQHGYEAEPIELELWSTDRDRHAADEAEELESQLLSGTKDVLVGRLQLPVAWVANAYGGGYSVSQDEPCLLRMVLEGAEPRTYPYEVELKVSYIPTPEHSQRAKQRFTSLAFRGRYELDVSASDAMVPMLREQGVPFVLRKLEESATEQQLEVRVVGGGTRVSFTTETSFYTDSTGPMKVDELFQSVKTYRGAVVEKRLYWDWSCMPRMRKGEPYPTGILMVVTRVRADATDQVIEAWDLSRDRSTLTQLAMVGEKRFKRVWRRLDSPVESPVKHPKVLTRNGQLIVAAIRGLGITPEDDAPVRAFAALKVVPFDNKDTRYTSPLRDDAKEETTQVFEGDPNPTWNQVFSFSIRTSDELHNVLILQVWNRESGDEEALIGTLRVPVPWVFNGFGSDLGPAGISSYEASFKLRRGDALDPTAKTTYGGGRVVLRFTFQPSFE